MATVRAVLFDFGGTLYDYATLEPAERESLVELARCAGIDAEPRAVQRAHRDAMRRVFRSYLPRRFYLHRDLFRDALVGMLEDLGARVDAAALDRYRAAQWERHARDFALRDGVTDTLDALRARGLHLGIVSNIDDDQLTHLLELAAIAPYFDSVISSEQAQSCKPDASIFAAALRRAGCAPEEALFVGDTLAQDIAGANRVGLQSVLLWHRQDRDPPTEEPRPRHVIRRIPDLLGLLE
jgi:putative hydrolase of the HAD superfamily